MVGIWNSLIWSNLLFCLSYVMWYNPNPLLAIEASAGCSSM
eukprot:SAG31_NODE_3486_length_4210_cov_1.754074_5_plen_41_part_00